jgi:hypothetical protein
MPSTAKTIIHTSELKVSDDFSDIPNREIAIKVKPNKKPIMKRRL